MMTDRRTQRLSRKACAAWVLAALFVGVDGKPKIVIDQEAARRGRSGPRVLSCVGFSELDLRRVQAASGGSYRPSRGSPGDVGWGEVGASPPPTVGAELAGSVGGAGRRRHRTDGADRHVSWADLAGDGEAVRVLPGDCDMSAVSEGDGGVVDRVRVLGVDFSRRDFGETLGGRSNECLILTLAHCFGMSPDELRALVDTVVKQVLLDRGAGGGLGADGSAALARRISRILDEPDAMLDLRVVLPLAHQLCADRRLVVVITNADAYSEAGSAAEVVTADGYDYVAGGGAVSIMIFHGHHCTALAPPSGWAADDVHTDGELGSSAAFWCTVEREWSAAGVAVRRAEVVPIADGGIGVLDRVVDELFRPVGAADANEGRVSRAEVARDLERRREASKDEHGECDGEAYERRVLIYAHNKLHQLVAMRLAHKDSKYSAELLQAMTRASSAAVIALGSVEAAVVLYRSLWLGDSRVSEGLDGDRIEDSRRGAATVDEGPSSGSSKSRAAGATGGSRASSDTPSTPPPLSPPTLITSASRSSKRSSGALSSPLTSPPAPSNSTKPRFTRASFSPSRIPTPWETSSPGRCD